ncbi:MAG: DNA-3-methyladenine glycosylase [Thermomicrobiales bacterium]|nr:DNA-3-methyladenine glycosylase [Thermomicrobiales bacterium]
MSSAAESVARLGREFFARPTLQVARSLLGCVVHTVSAEGETSGRIVEVEGYLGASDLASHAARLKRGRVLSMSGPPGIAYVYRSMGLHAMLNVVTEQEGIAGAVLIRALEPLTGIELMRARRVVEDVRLLCSGPGRLCQALGIGLDDHGVDVTASERIWVGCGAAPKSISVGGRIGISRAVEEPWRFFETGSQFVSAHRRGTVLAP